jgi:hypothetical protein
MVDSIERLENVEQDHRHSASRLTFIEPGGDLGDYWKKCCDGAVNGFVPVLCRRGRKRLRDVREKKTFQDFDSWGKEKDGAVTGALINELSWFRNGDNVGLLPDSREVSVGKGEVEEVG